MLCNVHEMIWIMFIEFMAAVALDKGHDVDTNTKRILFL